MSRTESAMVQLGTEAPDFTLRDVVSGAVMKRDDLMGVTADAAPHGLLLMFVCVHCPYVKHVEEQLAMLGEDYAGRIAMAAISSNDVVAYPQDGPEAMKAQAARLGWKFPYLFDETQQVARAYSAECTPDFFLFNAERKLVYRGQLDASRPQRGGAGNDRPVDGADLRRAMDDVLAGRTPDSDQRSSIGCNIKWRSEER